MKKKYVSAVVVATVAAVLCIIIIRKHYQPVAVDYPILDHVPATPTPTPTPGSPVTAATPPAQPSTINLPVPFTPQAPTGNWDELHNEACEEASALMANAYFAGEKATTLDASYVEAEISKLTKWQDDNLGYHLDSTSAEVATMIEQVYGLHTKLVDNFTFDDIKNELSQKHVVLISENGQKLGNPNYKQPGPIHHMLVIRGYSGKNVITNDSGTRKGLNYIYTYDTVKNAAADWSHDLKTVTSDKQVMIVVSK